MYILLNYRTFTKTDHVLDHLGEKVRKFHSSPMINTQRFHCLGFNCWLGNEDPTSPGPPSFGKRSLLSVARLSSLLKHISRPCFYGWIPHLNRIYLFWTYSKKVTFPNVLLIMKVLTDDSFWKWLLRRQNWALNHNCLVTDVFQGQIPPTLYSFGN